VFKSCGKGFYFVYINAGYGGPYDKWTGNISTWSGCYDLAHIELRYNHVSGELSSLSKLQKLKYVDLYEIDLITGSKEDLYNNGANIEHFSYAFHP